MPLTFRSKKSSAVFSPRTSWMPCHAAIWTTQSLPSRNSRIFFAIQDGALDKHRLRISTTWGANIQHYGGMPFADQQRDKHLPKITGPSCQQHLHGLSLYLTRAQGHDARSSADLTQCRSSPRPRQSAHRRHKLMQSIAAGSATKFSRLPASTGRGVAVVKFERVTPHQSNPFRWRERRTDE